MLFLFFLMLLGIWGLILDLWYHTNLYSMRFLMKFSSRMVSIYLLSSLLTAGIYLSLVIVNFERFYDWVSLDLFNQICIESLADDYETDFMYRDFQWKYIETNNPLLNVDKIQSIKGPFNLFLFNYENTLELCTNNFLNLKYLFNYSGRFNSFLLDHKETIIPDPKYHPDVYSLVFISVVLLKQNDPHILMPYMIQGIKDSLFPGGFNDLMSELVENYSYHYCHQEFDDNMPFFQPDTLNVIVHYKQNGVYVCDLPLLDYFYRWIHFYTVREPNPVIFRNLVPDYDIVTELRYQFLSLPANERFNLPWRTTNLPFNSLGIDSTMAAEVSLEKQILAQNRVRNFIGENSGALRWAKFTPNLVNEVIARFVKRGKANFIDPNITIDDLFQEQSS